MSAGDPAVVELFGDDAELVGLGQRVHGIDAIRTFYERSIADWPRPSRRSETCSPAPTR